MIDRRTFLATTAAAALASLAPRRLLAAVEANTPAMPDVSTWSGLRSQFDLATDRLHFETFFLASHPRPVREAIDAYRKAIDAEPMLEVEHRMFTDDANNIQYALRDQMSGYLGAKRDEIAITGSTTASLAMVYAGLPLEPGDEVLTTDYDHYSQHESIRFATKKARATMRRFKLYESAPRATVAEMTKSLRAAIRPETRVVGLTWVHSCTGVRIPVRALADVIADVNRGRGAKDRIFMVLDGAHGFGSVDDTVSQMGCDYFCSGTHKWMWGPRGTGIIWAKEENWARLTPTVPSFSDLPAWMAWAKGEEPPKVSAYIVSPGGFHAFEHQWGMGTAFRMHEAISRSRVTGRIAELNTRCKAGLAAIRGVSVVTPRDPNLSAGIVCFEVAGKTPDAIAEKMLERKIVGSSSPYLPSYMRLAPSALNTPEEVDQAVAAVREIAAAPMQAAGR